jgi:hypothetical protein
MRFLRFMLMNVGSIDHHPQAVAAYESWLIKQFNLNAQEPAFIHAEGQRLNALLKQLRSQSQAVLSGKKNLSASDSAALTALINQREQLITTLDTEATASYYLVVDERPVGPVMPNNTPIWGALV